MRKSNKMPIKWHQECLQARVWSNINRIEQRDKLNQEIDRNEKQIKFYEFQLNQAIKNNLTEYDRDRYLVDKSLAL